jgi:branched-chain amino acid transport system substrate-binding protein
MGYRGQLIKIAGGGESAIAAAPEALEGFIFHIEADVAGATGKTADFYKECAKRRSGQVLGFAAFSHDGFMMMCEAMRRAGTVEDTNAVRVALEQMQDYDGLVGKLNWTGKETYGIDHQIYADTSYLGKAVNGKLEVFAKIKR